MTACFFEKGLCFMNDGQVQQILHEAIDRGQGVLRLAPTWVPRSFCVPGRRLRLHPHDLYALGAAASTNAGSPRRLRPITAR
jgi:hypothetical protein